jgi:hypothetical protein
MVLSFCLCLVKVFNYGEGREAPKLILAFYFNLKVLYIIFKVFLNTDKANISTFKSKRGWDKVESDGYSYTFRRKNGDENIWRYDLRSCLGAAVTNESALTITKNHNHPPDNTKIHSKKFLAKLKSKAISTSEHPKNKLKNMWVVQIKLV